jgi:hypothetical protein
VKKLITLSAVLLLGAQVACARDFRHLRFSSTPTESDQATIATTREVREAPYALTGKDVRRAGPALSSRQTWVVGNPNFHPGK